MASLNGQNEWLVQESLGTSLIPRELSKGYSYYSRLEFLMNK